MDDTARMSTAEMASPARDGESPQPGATPAPELAPMLKYGRFSSTDGAAACGRSPRTARTPRVAGIEPKDQERGRPTMRQFTRAGAAGLAAVLVLVAATVLAEGAMRAQKVASIAVDGSLTDWKDVAVQPLGNTATIAAIAQDERFLYVNFAFTDLTLARRILRSGTIVWFNATGKHEPDLGLRYRGTDDLQKAYEALLEAAPEPVATPAARTRGTGGGRAARQRQPLGTL